MEMKRGEGGVTLIELAVVLAIIAIMALFVAPAVGEWFDNFRIRQGTKDIVSNLQLARMKAISSQLEYRVDFDVANNQYRLWVNDGGWAPDPEGGVLRTPRGVGIVSTTDLGDPPQVEFYPNGTSSAPFTEGTITINNVQGKQYQVFVSRTGRIGIKD
jgi:prepilin-type N-terminal cleavage/methylation domain-containing protein